MPPTSEFLSKMVKSIPGTLAGSSTPAEIPERPAPMTATCSRVSEVTLLQGREFLMTYSEVFDYIDRMVLELEGFTWEFMSWI